MIVVDEDSYLMHYGILRRSGRYPWGSGGPEYNTGNRSFLDHVANLRSKGLSEVEIARGLGLHGNGREVSTTELRAAISIAKNADKQDKINQAQALKDKGYSNIAIGKKMGINESSVRSLLTPGAKDRADVLHTTASILRDEVAQKDYIDVSKGVEVHMGISADKLRTAVAMLQEEGYNKYYVKIPQVGNPGKFTSLKILAKPDVPYSEVYKNQDKISQLNSVNQFSKDGGRSYLTTQAPLSISSKRIGINYKEDGGAQADGVIYVRPGVKDVSLDGSRYAQVRIAVDGTHFLKGMAMYKEDLPPGIDLVFNTNKSNTGNKLDAMKPFKKDVDGNVDPTNPFGSAIRRQVLEKDEHGKSKVTSAMNIVNEEGNWESWSRNLSSQLLSKQTPKLAKEQLDMAYEKRKNELDSILKLTNPAIKRKLLESFADNTDSASVQLKAHILPRTANHVILPIKSMKENEVYAPNYKDGEKVVLIRFPHGGKFEIPELTVNNKNREARVVLGHKDSELGPARDAVGIHPKVAERLSGADFDGDTVLVIPNPHGKIKTEPALEALKGFDPKASYPKYDGMKVMKPKHKQIEMGKVSNLITDMTIRGATNSELARAVRHSMVVIDAEKHELDWKASARDNGIAQLTAKYQAPYREGNRAGASTLFSRRKGEVTIAKRAPRKAAAGGPIDRTTGKKVFDPTNESYVNNKGKLIVKTEKVTRLGLTEDAHTLSSHTPVEKVYADHSNRLKSLANEARLAQIHTKNIPISDSAKKVYADEVHTLNAKLNLAKKNAPLERQAQLIANTLVSMRTRANPDMDPADLKKIKSAALIEGRARTGAGKNLIEITPREWDAIQAGAISNNKLEEILNNTNLEKVKQLATPKSALKMTTTKVSRAKSMIASGYTQAEIADALGVSLSTLKLGLGGEQSDG